MFFTLVDNKTSIELKVAAKGNYIKNYFENRCVFVSKQLSFSLSYYSL